MSDASSPQVRDHETREQRMDRRKTEPSGRTEKREITAVKKNLFVRRARQRERERERERERRHRIRSDGTGQHSKHEQRRSEKERYAARREAEEGKEEGTEGGAGGWQGWEKIKRADKPRGGLYPRSFTALFLLFASAYQPPPSPSSFFLHRFHRPPPSSSPSFLLGRRRPLLLSLLLSCPSPLYYSYFHARVRPAMWFDDHPHALFFSVCASDRACNARDMQSPRGPREIRRPAGNIVSRGGVVLLLNFCMALHVAVEIREYAKGMARRKNVRSQRAASPSVQFRAYSRRKPASQSNDDE